MGKSQSLNPCAPRKKTLAQHEEKKSKVKFASQIDKTILNVKLQIETIEEFIKDKNLAQE